MSEGSKRRRILAQAICTGMLTPSELSNMSSLSPWTCASFIAVECTRKPTSREVWKNIFLEHTQASPNLGCPSPNSM